MRSVTPALHDVLDLAIDFATLGEYGLAPPAHLVRADRGPARLPADIHRVCPAEGRSAEARGRGPDPRVAPVTPAARRRAHRSAAALTPIRGLEQQRRLGATVHARRPPAPVTYLDDARRRRTARCHAVGEQLALDFVA